jgi:hypothetical protein
MAKDLAYSNAMGVKPISLWSHVAGFSDLFYFHKHQLPPLMVQDAVPMLHRDPADWVAARFWADGGRHRTASAWHAQLIEDAIVSYWMDEQAQHTLNCERPLEGNPRFFDINLTTQTNDIKSKLLIYNYDLKHGSNTPSLHVGADKIQQVVSNVEALPAAQAPAASDLNFIWQASVFL